MFRHNDIWYKLGQSLIRRGRRWHKHTLIYTFCTNKCLFEVAVLLHQTKETFHDKVSCKSDRKVQSPRTTRNCQSKVQNETSLRRWNIAFNQDKGSGSDDHTCENSNEGGYPVVYYRSLAFEEVKKPEELKLTSPVGQTSCPLPIVQYLHCRHHELILAKCSNHNNPIDRFIVKWIEWWASGSCKSADIWSQSVETIICSLQYQYACVKWAEMATYCPLNQNKGTPNATAMTATSCD